MRRRTSSVRRQVLVGVIAGLFLLGLGLALYFEDHFLPSRLVPTPGVGMLFLLPVSLAALLAGNDVSPLSARYPTKWVRVLVWPLFLFILAGLLYLSLLGWVAASSYAVADRVSVQLAVVQAVGPEEGSRRRSCTHSMKVTYGTATTTMCADSLPGRQEVRPGAMMLLAGPQSPLGLHVTELRQLERAP